MPNSFDAAFHFLHTARALRCSANGRKRKINLAGTSVTATFPDKGDVVVKIIEELIPRLVTALMISMGFSSFSASDLAGFVVENAPRNFLTPFWIGARAVRWILR